MAIDFIFISLTKDTSSQQHHRSFRVSARKQNQRTIVHDFPCQGKFKKKVKGILDSVKDEYKRVLRTEFVTVSFVTPLEEELEELGQKKEADLFRFLSFLNELLVSY